MAKPGCGCAAPAEALPSRAAPALRARGHLQINREALRHALGGGVIIEHNDVPAEDRSASGEKKASGRPSVNVGVMWAYFTTSVYKSGDLPIIATREALQNGLDAIRMAVAARQIKKDEGRFDVVWDGAAHTLSWADNGIGMAEDTILTKFLSLGESGKKSSSGSGEQSGGFGVAKAVILGTSTTFHWEMHSRDNRAVADGADGAVDIFEAPFRQGTQITVYNVSAEFDWRYDYARHERVSILDRLREVLSANDLDIEITLNGEAVPKMFSRRGGAKVASGGNWGEGTTATVKAYRRMPGDRGGAYYLRLGGLYQYKAAAQRHGLPADIVVDLATSRRPGDRGYPLNAARDGLQDEASYRFSDLVSEVEKENESTGRDLDDEVFEAESDDELSDLTRAAFDDPTFQEAMRGAAGGLFDYYEQRGRHLAVSPVDSAAPAGTRVAEDGPSRRAPPGLFAAGALHIAQDIGAVAQIRTFLSAAENEEEPGETPTVISPHVEKVLDHAEAGAPLDSEEALVLEHAITRATEVAVQKGGLLQAAAAPAVYAALDGLAPTSAAERKRKRQNPFAKFGSLRVSRKNYDRAKARRFRQQWVKWIPYLVVWNMALRMIAAEARIRRKFGAGFVLNDAVNAEVSTEKSGPVVYIHPDRFKLAVAAHRERPLAIAYYVHSLGCHELTHLDGRMGEGHSETFVSAREDLGRATAHLLVPLSALIVRTLELPPDKVLCPQTRPQDVVPIVLFEILSLLSDPPSGLDSSDVQSYFRTSRRKLVQQFSELLLTALQR